MVKFINVEPMDIESQIYKTYKVDTYVNRERFIVRNELLYVGTEKSAPAPI